MAIRSSGLLDEALYDVLRAVDLGAQLAPWIQEHTARALEKPDRTPLTVADLAVQALVASALERSYPDVPLVAEEDASTVSGEAGQPLAEQVLHFLRPLLPGVTAPDLVRLLGRGGASPAARFWTLDPIDGTEGFLRGGHYVVALALIEDYKVTVGMLGCPTLDLTEGRTEGTEGTEGPGGTGGPGRGLGSLLVALRGHGTWVSASDAAEFHAVRVSEVRLPHEARMVRGYAESHINVEATRRVLQAVGIERPPILMDGQSKHAMIAAGRADLLVRITARPDYREHIWDHAAGALAIEEAGGQISDLDGQPLDFSAGQRLDRNRGIVAANGHLHAPVIAALRAGRAS